MRCGFFLSMDTSGLSSITSQSPFVRLSLSDQRETHSLSQILQELPSYLTETMKIPELHSQSKTFHTIETSQTPPQESEEHVSSLFPTTVAKQCKRKLSAAEVKDAYK